MGGAGENLDKKMCSIFREVSYGVRVIYVILISRMSCCHTPSSAPPTPGIYDLWRIAVIFMFLQVIEINFALFASYLPALLLLLLLLSPCRVVVAPHHLSWNFKHFQLSLIRMLHISESWSWIWSSRLESDSSRLYFTKKMWGKKTKQDGEVNFSRFGICQSFRSSARVSFRQKFCRLQSGRQPVSHSDSAGCFFACLRFIKIH